MLGCARAVCAGAPDLSIGCARAVCAGAPDLSIIDRDAGKLVVSRTRKLRCPKMAVHRETLNEDTTEVKLLWSLGCVVFVTL